MAQPAPLPKGDYVLGTQDVEVERLGLQHLVWRPRASDAWRRAGFTVGQHLLDVGCGPGYAALDLAAIVGASGKSHRDRSLTEVSRSPQGTPRQAIGAQRRDDRGGPRPGCAPQARRRRRVVSLGVRVSHASARFVESDPWRAQARRTLVVHEYFNYSSWSLSPRQPGLAEFVQLVISSWRKSGGEPDIGPRADVVAAAGRIRYQGAPSDRRRDRPARFHLAVAEHVRGCRTGAFDGARVLAASSGAGDPGDVQTR